MRALDVPVEDDDALLSQLPGLRGSWLARLAPDGGRRRAALHSLVTDGVGSMWSFPIPHPHAYMAAVVDPWY